MNPRPITLLAALLVGCGTSPVGTGIDLPTVVAVSAEDFRGEVPCSNAPGAMRSFVATLTDLGTKEEPTSFSLPSSVVRSDALGGRFAPVSCLQAAGFSFVVPGHRYSAEVEAYDRTDLVALGPGSRVLVDPASGNYVPPRWTTHCGTNSDVPGQGPVVAAIYRTRYVRGCGPLSEAYSTETAIRIQTDNASGPPCGSDPGQVERFEATLVETGAVQTADCGEAIVFGGLEGSQTYHFELFGYEAGELFPTWGTSCFRTAQSGAIVDAGCGTLLASGSMEVETAAVIASLGESCGPGAIVSVAGDIIATGNPTSVPCGATIRFDGLEPKSYGVHVSTLKSDGSAGPKAICDAIVVPGIARRANCRPE